MEALLVQEAIASEKEDSKTEKEIPKKKAAVAPAPMEVSKAYVDDDDDDDLEFIELD